MMNMWRSQFCICNQCHCCRAIIINWAGWLVAQQ